MNNTPIAFNNIVSVSGKPGLYQIIAQNNKKGISLSSLSDNKTIFVDAQRTPISLLSNIQVFTQKNDTLLGEILKILIDKNYTYNPQQGEKEFIETFKLLLPELDYTRVRVHDIKKIAKWATLLKEKNIEIKIEE
ncbi:MAG: DUF5606 family protein [Chitinophagaceae bacterium]